MPDWNGTVLVPEAKLLSSSGELDFALLELNSGIPASCCTDIPGLEHKVLSQPTIGFQHPLP